MYYKPNAMDHSQPEEDADSRVPCLDVYLHRQVDIMAIFMLLKS